MSLETFLHEFRLPNNLLNIKSTDVVFIEREKRILNLINKILQREGINIEVQVNSPLSIGGTDAFYMYYSTVPIFVDSNPIDVMEEIRKILLRYYQSESFKEIHTRTVLNRELSEVHASVIIAEIIKFLSELAQEYKIEGKNRDAERIEKLLEQLCTSCSSCKKETKGKSGKVHVEKGSRISKRKDKVKKEDVDEESIEIDSIGSLTEKEISELMGRLTEKVKKIDETISQIYSWGTEAGEYIKSDDLVELINSVSVDFLHNIVTLSNKIIQNVQVFTRIIKEYGRKGIGLARYSITKNVLKAKATELALPDEIFWEKFNTGFITYEKFTIKEGAIYCLIDKSGSMRGIKTIWARAVALALLRKTISKKAQFFLRFFDDEVWHLVKGVMNVYKEIVSVLPDGGTSIMDAILTAINDIKNNKLDTKCNVIYIITDGLAPVNSKKLIKELKSINTKLFYVHIKDFTSSYNPELARVAKSTGGELFYAEPTEENAIKVVKVI